MKKTYVNLIKILKDSIATSVSVLFEGYKLSSLNQEVGETLIMFMARVKDKANNCDFREFYDRMMQMRDRFLYGVKEEKIRACLLSKTNLNTLAAVYGAAVDKENALNANADMSTSVNFVKTLLGKARTKRKPHRCSCINNKSCTTCTLRRHLSKDCQVRC